MKAIKKDNLTFNKYLFLLKIKHVVNILASMGHVLSPKDHVEVIFEGISSEYDNFLVSINIRSDPFFVEDIKSLLQA